MMGATVFAPRSRNRATLVAAQRESIRRLRDPRDARCGEDQR